MKTPFYLVVLVIAGWLVLAFSLIGIFGCSQGILEKYDNGEVKRIQINTFLQKIDIKNLKTANFEMEKYSEDPKKVKIKANPLIHNYGFEVGDND